MKKALLGFIFLYAVALILLGAYNYFIYSQSQTVGSEFFSLIKKDIRNLSDSNNYHLFFKNSVVKTVTISGKGAASFLKTLNTQMFKLKDAKYSLNIEGDLISDWVDVCLVTFYLFDDLQGNRVLEIGRTYCISRITSSI